MRNETLLSLYYIVDSSDTNLRCQVSVYFDKNVNLFFELDRVKKNSVNIPENRKNLFISFISNYHANNLLFFETRSQIKA